MIFILIFFSAAVIQLAHCLLASTSKINLKALLVIKIFASLGFVACALFCALNFKLDYPKINAFMWIIVVGAIFGFAGDILLGLRHIYVDDHKKFKWIFLSGSITFFVGHVLYLIAVGMFTDKIIYAIIFGIVAMIIVTRFLYRLLEAKTKYKVMGDIYLAILFSFFAASCLLIFDIVSGNITGLHLPTNTCVFLAVGSLMFSIADCLTSYKSFGKKDKYVHWIAALDLPFYFVAQMLICSSLFFLL